MSTGLYMYYNSGLMDGGNCFRRIGKEGKEPAEDNTASQRVGNDAAYGEERTDN
jgi:hypothetical protein